MTLCVLEEKMCKDILETISCVVIVDENGNIVYLNKKYAEILGTTPETAIGKPVVDVIPNTSMHIVAKSDKNDVGVVFTMKNGETVVCNRYPIIIDGKIKGAFAHTTFTKPNEVKDFIKQIDRLKNELNFYKTELETLIKGKYSLEHIVGTTPSVLQLKSSIKKVAQTKSNVLITGETGTGKELVAHAIHQESPRKHKPFIRLNCAAIPTDLLESELFGYEEGAFTGAKKGGKLGKFELAQGGTLLLDEINQLPLNLQPKLLRVIQEKEIERIGGIKTRYIDVRLICISNTDLYEAIHRGEFREDLFYRINVVNLNTPPLRERIDDIRNLTSHFVDKINKELGLNITGVTRDALQLFSLYDWPGNIRELEYAIERAANNVLSGLLKKGDFDFIEHRLNKSDKGAIIKRNDTFSLKDVTAEAEKEAIIKALIKSNGNKSKASEILEIDRSVLYDKIRKYNIST